MDPSPSSPSPPSSLSLYIYRDGYTEVRQRIETSETSVHVPIPLSASYDNITVMGYQRSSDSQRLTSFVPTAYLVNGMDTNMLTFMNTDRFQRYLLEVKPQVQVEYSTVAALADSPSMEHSSTTTTHIVGRLFRYDPYEHIAYVLDDKNQPLVISFVSKIQWTVVTGKHLIVSTPSSSSSPSTSSPSSPSPFLYRINYFTSSLQREGRYRLVLSHTERGNFKGRIHRVDTLSGSLESWMLQGRPRVYVCDMDSNVSIRQDSDSDSNYDSWATTRDTRTRTTHARVSPDYNQVQTMVQGPASEETTSRSNRSTSDESLTDTELKSAPQLRHDQLTHEMTEVDCLNHLPCTTQITRSHLDKELDVYYVVEVQAPSIDSCSETERVRSLPGIETLRIPMHLANELDAQLQGQVFIERMTLSDDEQPPNNNNNNPSSRSLDMVLGGTAPTLIQTWNESLYGIQQILDTSSRSNVTRSTTRSATRSATVTTVPSTSPVVAPSNLPPPYCATWKLGTSHDVTIYLKTCIIHLPQDPPDIKYKQYQWTLSHRGDLPRYVRIVTDISRKQDISNEFGKPLVVNMTRTRDQTLFLLRLVPEQTQGYVLTYLIPC